MAQRVWLGHNLRHGDLVPLFIEARIIGKSSLGRPRVGMLDRVKNGSPHLRSSQQAGLRSRTVRKDLPVGRIHTQLYKIKNFYNEKMQ